MGTYLFIQQIELRNSGQVLNASIDSNNDSLGMVCPHMQLGTTFSDKINSHY